VRSASDGRENGEREKLSKVLVVGCVEAPGEKLFMILIQLYQPEFSRSERKGEEWETHSINQSRRCSVEVNDSSVLEFRFLVL